jgi:hypothetical protein
MLEFLFVLAVLMFEQYSTFRAETWLRQTTRQAVIKHHRENMLAMRWAGVCDGDELVKKGECLTPKRTRLKIDRKKDDVANSSRGFNPGGPLIHEQGGCPELGDYREMGDCHTTAMSCHCRGCRLG